MRKAESARCVSGFTFPCATLMSASTELLKINFEPPTTMGRSLSKDRESQFRKSSAGSEREAIDASGELRKNFVFLARARHLHDEGQHCP